MVTVYEISVNLSLNMRWNSRWNMNLQPWKQNLCEHLITTFEGGPVTGPVVVPKQVTGLILSWSLRGKDQDSQDSHTCKITCQGGPHSGLRLLRWWHSTAILETAMFGEACGIFLGSSPDGESYGSRPRGILVVTNIQTVLPVLTQIRQDVVFSQKK